MLTKRINPVAILAVLAFALIASTALAQDLILDEPVSTSAEMYTYKDAASGEQYFALSVSPSPTEMPASGRNIVIVADTSASIAANYRQQELDTIKTFVSSLNPATDKVCLVASDVDSSELTKGFVSPDSEEFQNAYKALEDRVPLGAMNIETAMKTAASQPFNAGNNSIMFIGSGTSRAKTLSPAQFDAICKDLASKKLPVNSVQIGPNPDARVLSCLAAKTGGMSIVPSDDANQSVSDTVAAMDSATAANVVWPDQASVKWPASFKPAMDFPPLRTDRDSMIVGTYTGDGSLDLTANTSDGAQSWSAKPENTAEKFDYIKQLVTMANGSNGLVPLVSKEDMYKAENAMFDRVNELTRLANSAINTGDIQDAQNLVNELKNLDPQNADVQNLEKLIAENGNGQAIALDDGPTDFDLLDSSGLLDSADSSMGAITQQQVGEVTRTINDARATLRIDPEGAIQNLKNMREAVRRNADIKAADRDALVRNLEAAIREAQQYGDQMAQRNAEAARRMAEAQDRKILAEQMMSQMEKMNQMGKRFESTCKEKKYEQAQDLMVDMANEMSDLDNRMPTAIAGIQWTRNLDNYVKQVQLRSLKQRKVCDTLYQSDKAVPG